MEMEIETVQKHSDKLESDETDGLEEVIQNIASMDDDYENSSGNTRRVSVYGVAGKKTSAQGLMDIALLTANANQLRYLLEYNRKSNTFHITLTLIISSLSLQVAVAMILIFKGRYYLTGKSKSPNAKRIKNIAFFAVFLIMVINVFIASFTTIEREHIYNVNNLTAI